MKKTEVVLKIKGVEKSERKFKIDHAERILKMNNNGGWELADNNFIQEKDGNITKKYKGNSPKTSE